MRRVVCAFIGGASCVVVIGIAQYTNASIDDFAVRATFGNRNVLGGYLALVLPLSYGLMLHEDDWRRCAWYGLLIAGGLVLTLAGGTFIAVAASFLLLSALKSTRVLALCAVAVVLWVAFLMPHTPRSNDEVLFDSVRLHLDDNQVSRRYTQWQAASAMLSDNLMLGVGADNYQENIGRYYGILPSPTGASEHDTENLYLVLASSIGLPGALCFVALLLVSAIKAFRLYPGPGRDRSSGLALGCLGSIVAFSINSIWSPLLVRGVGIPLVVLLGLVAALERTRADAGIEV
jgi:O-antigen ligase